jgi:hypothetical protein
MSNQETYDRIVASRSEIYQLECKIVDFKHGQADAPLNVEKAEKRLAELKQQLAELSN